MSEILPEFWVPMGNNLQHECNPLGPAANPSPTLEEGGQHCHLGAVLFHLCGGFNRDGSGSHPEADGKFGPNRAS